MSLEQKIAVLANAEADEWQAQKREGAEVLADILIEYAQEQVQYVLDVKAQEIDPLDSVDLDWDDEQTVEVLEAAIAILKRRHRLAREV